MRQGGKKLLALALVCTMICSLVGCGQQAQTRPIEPEPPQELQQAPQALRTPLEDIATTLQKNVQEPTVGSLGGDWTIMALARSGLEIPQMYLDDYYDRVVSYVKDCKGVLDERKYTEYSRVILALTALGKDPSDVGGYNLLAPLADFNQTVFQGINGAIFALIALDSGDYEIPACEEGKTQATRALYVQHILDRQAEGGGWSFAGGAPEMDMTAMALQALAPYTSQPEVQTAVEQGIMLLSETQLETGGYSYGEDESCESIAQAILALTALGISPEDERFTKGEHTLLSRMMDFYHPGEGFSHLLEGTPEQMATEQAFQALVAVHRFERGLPSLFDMHEVGEQLP